MKKRISLLMLVFVLVVSVCTVTAFAEDERVEIEFCVGDSILTINGEKVEVETPYVVGEGVTLVPVRVITEAFGAKVDWIHDTQTVTLDYPDVNIILQIGNPVAEVNGKAVELLAAPELPNSSTMVPLRFISENFGATVDYDIETERITVVKEASGGAGSMVEGAVDSKYIGDSYYGWKMENPKDAVMNMRYFDGTYTAFSFDENNGMNLSIYALSDEYSFEESYAGLKETFQYYTLIKADKDTSNSNKKIMHFQARDTETFIDYYEFFTDKYVFVLYGNFEDANKEMKAEGTRILSTFDAEFSGDDIYDMSNVEDDLRIFEADKANLSFGVPADYLMLSAEEAENYFEFCSIDPEDNDSAIYMCIYSKDGVDGAKALAEKDYIRNKTNLNEKISKFDEGVTQKQYGNLTAYEYSHEVDGISTKFYARDVFFEIGDYVYNMYVSIKTPMEDKEALVDSIVASIDAEAIDSEEMGIILYNSETPEGTFESDTLNKCTMEIPNSYTPVSETKTMVTYNSGHATFAGTIYTDEEYTYSKAKELVKDLETNTRKMEGNTILQSTTDITLGKTRFAKLCYMATENDSTVYVEAYATAKDGVAYTFLFASGEEFYSEHTREEIKGILESVVLK